MKADGREIIGCGLIALGVLIFLIGAGFAASVEVTLGHIFTITVGAAVTTLGVAVYDKAARDLQDEYGKDL